MMIEELMFNEIFLSNKCAIFFDVLLIIQPIDGMYAMVVVACWELQNKWFFGFEYVGLVFLLLLHVLFL